MTVKLMVNWREREITTERELADKIDDRVKEMLEDKDTYEEYLDDYIDCNYTKMELFGILASDNQSVIEETLDDIRNGVQESIFDWCDMDIRSDYEEVKIEV